MNAGAVVEQLGPEGAVALTWARGASSWTATAADLGPVRLTIGRKGARDKFASALLSWSSSTTGPWARSSRPRVGERVELELTAAACAYLGLDPADWTRRRRARAYVTDCQLGYVIRNNRPEGVLTWTATGVLARAGRVDVGDTPWPQEAAAVRLGRLSDAAVAALGSWPYAADLALVQPGADATVILARDVDKQPYGRLLEELAADTGGLLIEQPHGQLTYYARDERRSRTPVVQLEPAELLATATWATSLGELCNRHAVSYGPDPQATVTVDDPSSRDAYGAADDSASTKLAEEAAARDLAALTVGRSSLPKWGIDELEADVLRTLPAAKAAALVAAELGELVQLVGLPAEAPDTDYLYVEGLELEVSRHAWRVKVSVADAGQTGAPARWADVVGMTWAELDPELSWLQSAGSYFPPAELGRWTDVAADTSWLELDPAKTWASW